MRQYFRSALLFVLLAGSATACATSGTAGAVNSSSRSAPITLAEIRQASASNALELVQALRPNWLRARGQTSIRYGDEVAVYLNHIRLGTIESLREISANDIGSIEYVEPRHANMRWGAGHTQGAIVVNNRN